MKYFISILILLILNTAIADEVIEIDSIKPVPEKPLFSTGKDIEISMSENGIGERHIRSTKSGSVILYVKDGKDKEFELTLIRDGKTLGKYNKHFKTIISLDVATYTIRCESKSLKTITVNMGYLK